MRMIVIVLVRDMMVESFQYDVLVVVIAIQHLFMFGYFKRAKYIR